MNYRISSLNRKIADKRRRNMKLNVGTIPDHLQNLKGENRRTGMVKGLQRNVHRTKKINHERTMPLSKSVNQIQIIVRKASKIGQKKATTEVETVSRTERLVERICKARKDKCTRAISQYSTIRLRTDVTQSVLRPICYEFYSRYVSSYPPCCPSSTPEVTC